MAWREVPSTRPGRTVEVKVRDESRKPPPPMLGHPRSHSLPKREAWCEGCGTHASVSVVTRDRMVFRVPGAADVLLSEPVCHPPRSLSKGEHVWVRGGSKVRWCERCGAAEYPSKKTWLRVGVGVVHSEPECGGGA